MNPRKQITALCLLLFLGIAAQGQDSIDTIAFNCQKEPPTVTHVGGEGILFHYTNQTDDYKGIYYLFTDAPIIKISRQSKLHKDKDYKLAFNASDTNSEWFSNNMVPLGNNALITQKMLDRDDPVSFRWKERANLLISTKDRKGKDNKHNLFLIILPMPPEDTLFSSIEKDIHVDEDSGTMSGTVTLHRTSRIIIDSVYVDGTKANATYSDDRLDRDIPYYGKDGFAEVEINCPKIPRNKSINLTVYCTRFNNDGTLTECTEDLKIDLSEESFNYWIVLAVLPVGLLVFLLLRLKNRRKNKPQTPPTDVSDLTRQLNKLTKENDDLKQRILSLQTEHEKVKHEMQAIREKAETTLQKEKEENMRTMQTKIEKMENEYHKMVASYKDKIAEMEQEMQRLKQSSQSTIDGTAFIQQCDSLIKEIEKLRTSMKGNPSLTAIDQRLKTLETIVIIKKQ